VKQQFDIDKFGSYTQSDQYRSPNESTLLHMLKEMQKVSSTLDGKRKRKEENKAIA